MLAAQAIRLGEAEVVVAGGMGNMTNAPYLLPKARDGYRMGHGALVDSMIKDGLWDVYNDFIWARPPSYARKSLRFHERNRTNSPLRSYKRAQTAQRDGDFAKEIVSAVTAARDHQEHMVTEDEESASSIWKK